MQREIFWRGVLEMTVSAGTSSLVSRPLTEPLSKKSIKEKKMLVLECIAVLVTVLILITPATGE
jgi:hypothetical protein